MSTLIGPDARISIRILVNMPGDDEHTQVISDDSLIDHMVHMDEMDESG